MSIMSIFSVDLEVEMLSKCFPLWALVLTVVIDQIRPTTQVLQCHGFGGMAQPSPEPNDSSLYNQEVDSNFPLLLRSSIPSSRMVISLLTFLFLPLDQLSRAPPTLSKIVG